MRNVLILIILFSNLHLFSQIVKPKVIKTDNPQCQIMQIGLTDSMTFVFYKYTSKTPEQSELCIDENSFIKINNTGKTYKLISCTNVPICPSFHQFDSISQTHYFSIAYQAIPKNINEIDIIGDINSNLNFFGVSLKDTNVTKDSTNYIRLLEETPVKEKGYFYKDGKVVEYYIYMGLIVTMNLNEENLYGDYYTAYISIENYTNKRFDFFPENIFANFYNDKIANKVVALSYSEYMNKVKKKQNLNAFFVALGESLASNSAGYSTSKTNSNTYADINTNIFGSSFFGDSYGYMSSNIRTYANFSTSGSTYNYNATAAYYVKQNAINNVENFINQQYKIKEVINQGYLKANTLFPNQRINGYVNINYKIANKIKVFVPVKGVNYSFEWPFKIGYYNKQNSDSALLMTEDEKLIELLKDKTYTEFGYSNFDEVALGDIVKFSTEYEKDIIGIIIEKKGNSTVAVKTFPSIGQFYIIEQKYKSIKKLIF